VFGEVVGEQDMAVVNSITQGDRIDTIEIKGNVEILLKEQREEVEKWNKKLD
jgi:peptidyl-prolyl cis-trans isomerase B (cyclophilin B)